MAPFIAVWLWAQANYPVLVGIYLSAMAVIALLLMRETRDVEYEENVAA
ncbi:hypothetical protein [Promicromonospora soli]